MTCKLYSAKRRNRVGGGVAIFVNDEIHATVIESQSTNTWSALWLLTKHPEMQTLIIGCFYHPPSDNSNQNLEYLEDTLNRLTIKHPRAKIVVSGDFNRMPLHDLSVQFNISAQVNFPTRGDATLDQILTDIEHYEQALCLPPLSGNERDHCCIHLPGQNIIKQKYKEVFCRQWNIQRKTDVLLDIARQDWAQVIDISDLDDMVEQYHTTINNILDEHCPKKRKKVRVDNSFFMSPLIEKIKKARDRAHKNHKKSPVWLFLSKLMKRLVRKAKRKSVSEKLNNAVASRTWWKEIDRIDGKFSDVVPNYHLLNDKWLSTSELTDELNQYFSNIGGSRDDMMSSCRNFPKALSPLSYGEVKLLLKQINSSKATYHNDTPAWLTKTAAEDLCVPVTHIINKMLEHQQYPNLWKHAEVRPLKKTANAKEPSQYRPIALLCHLGKIAADVILAKLKNYAESKLRNDQFAYRRKHSTTDALLKLINQWCSALDNSNTSHMSVAMIDMSKAFDRVHPNLLIIKLRQIEVPDGLITLIDSFLTHRTCSVRLGEAISATRDISMGTPQGTKLGPWLWLIYINDLSPPTPTVKYADDVTTFNIMKKHQPYQTELQNSLHYISQWSVENNMQLNTKKTQILKLTLSEPKHQDIYALDEGQITPSCTSKLLGVTLDAKLSFSNHVDDIVSRTNYKLFTMRRLKRLGAGQKCLLTFFKAHILSVICYASPAWSSLIADYSLVKLEQIQRKALKIIDPYQSYDENLAVLSLPTIRLLLDDTSREYYNKILYSNDHPLHHIIQPNQCTRSLRVRRMSYTPVCRTTKYANSLFIKYAH